MHWKSYEETVKNIYETLGKNKGIKIICYGNDCKCEGKSGVKHQIDVLFSFSDGIHEYKTAIECKYWNTKVNKDVIMKLIEILDDCKINKGIVVSKMGFTEDAIKFAENKGIELVELREPTDEDWKGRIRKIEVNMHILNPEIIDIRFWIDKDLIDDKQQELIEKFNKHLLHPELSTVYDLNENKTFTLQEIINRFFKEKFSDFKGNEEREYLFEFQNAKITIFLFDKELTIPIKGIYIKGILKPYNEKIEIDGEKIISMIMRDIFSGREYKLLKDGKIMRRD